MLNTKQELPVPLSELQFSFSRSSGPGGQNVNKVNSKVTLRWNPSANRSLPSAVRDRFLSIHQSRLNQEGEIVLHCDETRSRKINQEICLEKLSSMIRAALRPPKKRIPTRPSRASKERRRECKQHRSRTKRSRSGRWE